MPTETRIGSDPVAPIPVSGMDAASRSWVECLKASERRSNECLARLHALLLRVARHEAFRRGGSLDVRGPEIEDIALQAADDALIAIRAKVAGFRGESRFTTWAYRFVVFEVSTKISRHFWRHRPMAMDDDSWEQLPDPFPVLPEYRAELRETLAALRRAIDEDLTTHQRRVFVAVALNEVPMDAFALEIGSNRNAVYKTLFDARRKLRASLDAAGYPRPTAASAEPHRKDPKSIDELLEADDIDAGCAAGFEVMQRYVETELAGGDLARDQPGLAAHLRRCPACREDYLGLLDAVRRFGDDPSSA